MSTWFPDLFQHCHIQAELVDDKIVCIVLEPFETEPLIPPVLPEIAVHGVVLRYEGIIITPCVPALTMSTSDMGPMLLIRMLTFTSVGPGIVSIT